MKKIFLLILTAIVMIASLSCFWVVPEDGHGHHDHGGYGEHGGHEEHEGHH